MKRQIERGKIVSTELARIEIKQQLLNVADTLPFEKMQQLLDFADFLKQQNLSGSRLAHADAHKTLDEWEEALSQAEVYWFNLPESVRHSYAGKVVALSKNRIVDSDLQLQSLKRRVGKKFANQPILYLDADAELLPPLIIHSPNLG